MAERTDASQTPPFSIVIKDLEKRFPSAEQPALTEISANIKRGSITGLVGPDGAGKTTLMRIIAGLLSPTKGEVCVDNLNPLKNSDSLKAILSYMPQKFGLYEDLSVMENLSLYADLRGVIEKDRKTAFDQLLQFTDLEYFTDRSAGKLSGGMKQKLGLACALLGHPKILLLDEPSVGVDPVSRRELWKMVNALISEGMTVIWSTSYLDEAELCDDVLLLNQAKLMYAGKPDKMTEKLTNRSVQIQNIEGNNRLVLQAALRAPEVMDGVIQGRNVRLVLREEGKLPDLQPLNAGSNARIISVKPRFEDAFMDALGGGPGGDSVLTKVMKPVQSVSDFSSVIEASSLTKRFGDFVATDNISFKVNRGEIFGLLGPNGAGKSTTFKMMCGLLTPSSGTARVMGIDLQKSASQARQKLGYMAQKFSLYSDLTALQNLEFFSGIYGLNGKEQKQKVAEMVDVFDLHHLVNTKTNELALGFKQRLALACAIMHEPAILFLDEPTSGVDPITRREFWTHISGLVQKGVTVMVTTHYMDEAEYCDRIGLVYRGKLIATGTPDELKQLSTSEAVPDPTMEDTFIDLVQKHDQENPLKGEKQKSMSNHQGFQQRLFSHLDSVRRTLALCKKEFYQIIRDPSSILIAFILPIMMLFIFGYGINLDISAIRMGVVTDDLSPEARRFENAFLFSPYIEAFPFHDRLAAKKALKAGQVRGFVAIQSNFASRLKEKNRIAPVQIVTDGSEPNTANFVSAYAVGAWGIWQQQRSKELGQTTIERISFEPRYWFNPTTISRYYLIPGSIAIIMTVIGALLTSLVVAREWERGTMEALLSMPVTRMELFLSKLIPYYFLGISSMTLCFLMAITLFGVPFRGSLFLLFIETSLFLGSALGLGLLLSTTTRNQFLAAQAALNIAFLPAVMLSGFVWEISSAPTIIQAITYLFPARYFVDTLQTLFLAGNIPALLISDAIFLSIASLIFLGLTYRFTRRKLD